VWPTNPTTAAKFWPRNFGKLRLSDGDAFKVTFNRQKLEELTNRNPTQFNYLVQVFLRCFRDPIRAPRIREIRSMPGT